jgi:hypothetical protein
VRGARSAASGGALAKDPNAESDLNEQTKKAAVCWAHTVIAAKSHAPESSRKRNQIFRVKAKDMTTHDHARDVHNSVKRSLTNGRRPNLTASVIAGLCLCGVSHNRLCARLDP